LNSKLPIDFVKQIESQLGDSAHQLLAALSTPSPLSIRYNSLKSALPIHLVPVPWCKTAFYLDERPSFTLDPTLHAGAYYVQEASSMFLEQVFEQYVPKDEAIVVLDLCAAPGGKSTHLSTLVGENGLLVANEVIRQRANILAENAQKWGTGNIVVTNNDPEHFKVLDGFFDVMVIDAPCSGEGMFRKDAKAISEWSMEHVNLCSNRQRRILMDSWDALKSGGILIYSTCTYNIQENEENIVWLAQQHDLELLDLDISKFPQIQVFEIGGVKGYRFFPHQTRGEGFFLTVVRKNVDGDVFEVRRNKKTALQPLSKTDKALVNHWLLGAEDWAWMKRGDNIIALPENWLYEIDFILQKLKVIYAGIDIAEIKHKSVNPLHGLALSAHLNREAFQEVDVDKETALRYLRKEDILPETPHNGWLLITYEKLPLGWIKKMQNRANNYYPKEWRIRMDVNWEELL